MEKQKPNALRTISIFVMLERVTKIHSVARAAGKCGLCQTSHFSSYYFVTEEEEEGFLWTTSNFHHISFSETHYLPL